MGQEGLGHLLGVHGADIWVEAAADDHPAHPHPAQAGGAASGIRSVAIDRAFAHGGLDPLVDLVGVVVVGLDEHPSRPGSRPPLLCLASDPVSNLTCTSTGNYSPGATLGDMAIAVSID